MSSFLNNDDSQFSKTFLTVKSSDFGFPKISQTIPLKETAASYNISPEKKIPEFLFPCIKCKEKEMKFTKKLGESYMGNTFLCNGCSRIQNAGVKGVLHCDKCFFDLCSKCRFCPEGHFLKKVFKLNLEGEPKAFRVYPKDSFNCDVCHEFYKEFPYTFKCWPCGFDVCHKCIMKTKGHLF